MLYFAYGSNCDPAIMAKKQVKFTSRKRGRLSGYRLRFNKLALRERLPEGIGFANINEDPSGLVEGIIYEVVDEDVARLDESERYPDHYGRISIIVESDGGPIECQTYQAQPDKTADGLVPSRNYLNHILAGRDFLSQQYFEALDQSLTYVGDCAICHNNGDHSAILQGFSLVLKPVNEDHSALLPFLTLRPCAIVFIRPAAAMSVAIEAHSELPQRTTALIG